MQAFQALILPLTLANLILPPTLTRKVLDRAGWHAEVAQQRAHCWCICTFAHPLTTISGGNAACDHSDQGSAAAGFWRTADGLKTRSFVPLAQPGMHISALAEVLALLHSVDLLTQVPGAVSASTVSILGSVRGVLAVP